MPTAQVPHKNIFGQYDGSSNCASQYPTQRPPVPYGNQTIANSLVSEDGFKTVRGQLTEGRYLTFEANGYALTNSGGKLTTSKASAEHDAKAQRWVVHQQKIEGNQFTISSAIDGTYVGLGMNLLGSTTGALPFTIVDLGNGSGYSIQAANGTFVNIDDNGELDLCNAARAFTVYSVTYSN
jgi:phospholipase C